MSGAKRLAIRAMTQRLLRGFILLSLLLGFAASASLGQRLDQLEADTNQPAAARLAQLTTIEEQARVCAREQRQRLERLSASLQLLDLDQAAPETAAAQLLQRRNALQQQLADCELTLLRTESLQIELRQADRERFFDRLRAVGGDLATPLPQQWLGVLLVLITGLVLGFLLRNILAKRQASRLQRAIAYALPWLTPAALLGVSMPGAAALLPLLLILSATFAARGWLKATPLGQTAQLGSLSATAVPDDLHDGESETGPFVAEASDPAPLPTQFPSWLAPLLIALGLTLASRELLTLILELQPAVAPFRTLLGGASALLGLVMVTGLWRFGTPATTLSIACLMAFALAGATVADLLSRPALADYLTRGSIATLVGVGAWLAMNEALGRWLADSRLGKSVMLLLLVRLVALMLLLSWLIFAWNLPALGIGLDHQTLVSGVAIGDIHIHPLRLMLGLTTALALLVLVRWLQRLTSKDLSGHSSVDPAAGNTVVTIIGYIGVALTLVVALSVAGFDLTNLVIIAGALSLGIGFGLQTIVSNFVSGIILLFERPIRNGDWISVGNTEGLVTRIRVRATEIRSFDGADIVMPNSDLLAANVTNWTLSDAAGRVVIPVGIAYGSDTRKAEQLLLQAAREQELSVCDESLPMPSVVFRAFGESSLEFVLRFYISDVRSRLLTISATHFRIDELFRENGIEIAFPQRDIHVRSLPKGLNVDRSPEE